MKTCHNMSSADTAKKIALDTIASIDVGLDDPGHSPGSGQDFADGSGRLGARG